MELPILESWILIEGEILEIDPWTNFDEMWPEEQEALIHDIADSYTEEHGITLTEEMYARFRADIFAAMEH